MKFANLFNEGLKDFKIQLYGCQKSQETFSLGKPSLLNGKYVVYMTSGKDCSGVPFQGNRRYNEFYQLRELLRQSWPGLYIPNIPSKKFVGNKDVKFILERRFFLERFWLQLSRYAYLTTGEEYQVFSQPKQGLEIEKQMQKLPELSMTERL